VPGPDEPASATRLTTCPLAAVAPMSCAYCSTLYFATLPVRMFATSAPVTETM